MYVPVWLKPVGEHLIVGEHQILQLTPIDSCDVYPFCVS